MAGSKIYRLLTIFGFVYGIETLPRADPGFSAGCVVLVFDVSGRTPGVLFPETPKLFA